MNKKDTVAAAKARTMDDLVDNPLFNPKPIKRNKIVEGIVLSINDNEILVDLGTKAEGVILGKELRAEQDFLSQLKKGDSILASVAQVENDHGQVVLSLRRAGIERRWRKLEQAFEEKTPVKVKVIDFNRGGLLVDGGIRGFIPISQLSQNIFPSTGNKEEVEDSLEKLKGKEIEAYVLEANRKANKLILSARPLDQISFSHDQKAEVLSKIKSDDIISGTVTRIVPFGILVDIGGIDGLVHISEVSWDRLKKPEDLYSVGEKVKVLVLEKNEDEGKILLSLKRLQDDPWSKLEGKYSEGQEVEGEVTKLTTFGAFVRVGVGIDGLVHSSRLLDLNLELKVGDKGLFKITTLNVALKRMGLEPIVDKS